MAFWMDDTSWTSAPGRREACARSPITFRMAVPKSWLAPPAPPGPGWPGPAIYGLSSLGVWPILPLAVICGSVPRTGAEVCPCRMNWFVPFLTLTGLGITSSVIPVRSAWRDGACYVQPERESSLSPSWPHSRLTFAAAGTRLAESEFSGHQYRPPLRLSRPLPRPARLAKALPAGTYLRLLDLRPPW